jgi:hypothetical protein
VCIKYVHSYRGAADENVTPSVQLCAWLVCPGNAVLYFAPVSCHASKSVTAEFDRLK